MAKLYVFGIGGTGARVLKSLTMLLASGVHCNADSIVPIFIDPDENSGNLQQIQSLLQCYNNIRSCLEFDETIKNKFFETEIRQVAGNYTLPLKDVSNKLFNEYIGFSSLSKANKALISMLFSDKNLSANMNVGFKGNPNIGSVVLNQFAQSEEFKNFASSFELGDQIFIISSIFGGTGASGFPLLLKNLRGNNNIPNFAIINNATIGAITVMPYFNVNQDNESSINSSTFITKTKAALHYYERNISDTNSLDYLYYIGDDCFANYKNCEGGKEQSNDAHVVELFSALAILDFAGSAKTASTIHKEFGINDIRPNDEIILNSLCNSSKSLLQKNLSQLLLLAKYIQERFKRENKYQWQIEKRNQFDSKFWDSNFFLDLNNFLSEYKMWLAEMAKNKRSFSPFDLNVKNRKLFEFIKGHKPAGMRNFWYFNKSNFNLFDHVLNVKSFHSKDNGHSIATRFLNLFYVSTEEICNRKYNF